MKSLSTKKTRGAQALHHYLRMNIMNNFFGESKDADTDTTEKRIKPRVTSEKSDTEQNQYPDNCLMHVEIPENQKFIHSGRKCSALEQQLVSKKGELAQLFLQLRVEREKMRNLENNLKTKDIELKRAHCDLAEIHNTLTVLLDRINTGLTESSE